MAKSLVFFNNQLVDEWEGKPNTSQYLHTMWGSEVYNGGYVYWPSQNPQWYRCDLTPVLNADIPKPLLLLAAIFS